MDKMDCVDSDKRERMVDNVTRWPPHHRTSTDHLCEQGCFCAINSTTSFRDKRLPFSNPERDRGNDSIVFWIIRSSNLRSKSFP